jgi:hypothetical protein
LDLVLSQKARTNPDVFMSYVLKTEKGESVIQAQIHQEIHWHIDECRRRKERYCGILAPWGHGKTEQVVIGRTLMFLGENRNNRIFPVCNTDDNSKARVEAIRRYIMLDSDYHRVFPEVREADVGDWTKHKIVIERDSMSKDGSVESWGITSSGTGGRCDILIFDDPVDLRNAILNPTMRKTVKEAFKNVWMSRLVPDGFAIYIATVWHKDDLTNELLNNPEWKFLIMEVSEDTSCIKCKSPFKGEFTIPLWEIWNRNALLARRKVIGQRAYDRGFRQLALSDEDRTFPSSDKIFRYDIDRSVIRPDWPRVTGVDPFGKQVVIFTIALDSHTFQRYPIEVRRGKWDPTRTVQEIIAVNRLHRPQVMVVENNASQDTILQWAMSLQGGDLPLVPFTTGAQKANPEFGLPSMEVEFANGSWIVPMGKQHEPGCECGLCVWAQELRDHPVAEASDTVMASWFAREGARYLVRAIEINRGKIGQSDVITQEDMGIEDVVIGHYDYQELG